MKFEINPEYATIKEETEHQKKYHDFLNSEEWKETSDLFKAQVGYKCQICGKQILPNSKNGVLQVHHLSYVNVRNELANPSDVIVLCQSCHYKLHGVQRQYPTLKQDLKQKFESSEEYKKFMEYCKKFYSDTLVELLYSMFPDCNIAKLWNAVGCFCSLWGFENEPIGRIYIKDILHSNFQKKQKGEIK